MSKVREFEIGEVVVCLVTYDHDSLPSLRKVTGIVEAEDEYQYILGTLEAPTSKVNINRDVVSGDVLISVDKHTEDDIYQTFALIRRTAIDKEYEQKVQALKDKRSAKYAKEATYLMSLKDHLGTMFVELRAQRASEETAKLSKLVEGQK